MPPSSSPAQFGAYFYHPVKTPAWVGWPEKVGASVKALFFKLSRLVSVDEGFFSLSRNEVTQTKFSSHAQMCTFAFREERKKKPMKRIFLWVLRNRTGENNWGRGCERPKLACFSYQLPCTSNFPQLSCELRMSVWMGGGMSSPN